MTTYLIEAIIIEDPSDRHRVVPPIETIRDDIGKELREIEGINGAEY